MRTAAVLASAIALLAGVGCPERSVGKIEVEPSRVERVELPSETRDKIDLLFVIDDSHSMNEEQESLIDNFEAFINVLHNAKGGLPSLHIGVVTSDMGAMGGAPFGAPGLPGSCAGFGDAGELHMPAGVATANYLQDLRGATPDAARLKNYTRDELREAFKEAATVGVKGCNFESHLMSMKRALDGNPLNQGFLRPEAYLAVVLIADEDDCSVAETGQGFFSQPDLREHHSSFLCFRDSTVCDGPADPAVPGPRSRCRPRERSAFHAQVSAMVSFLKSVKPEDQLIVAGIYAEPGDVEVVRSRAGGLDVRSSCPAGTSQQIARPPVRLDAFVRQFRKHLSTSICGEDLSGPMREIAELVSSGTGSPCLTGQPAVPHYCSVSEVIDPSGPERRAETLPECDAGHSRKPCWHLEENREVCPTTETHLAITIDRGGAPPPINSHVVAECVTQ